MASFPAPWKRCFFEEELAEKTSRRAAVKLNNADPDQAIVAYIFFRLIIDEMHILNFAVCPDWRRKGVATSLLNHAFTLAMHEGAINAFLEVRASNYPAIGLYKKVGFQQTGQRRQYYSETNEDAIVMAKKL